MPGLGLGIVDVLQNACIASIIKHACSWLRCYKPPLTEEEKAERKAAQKKRKKKEKTVKSEESDGSTKNLAISIFRILHSNVCG